MIKYIAIVVKIIYLSVPRKGVSDMAEDNHQSLTNDLNEFNVASAGTHGSFHTAEVFVPADAKFHTVPVTGSSRPDLTGTIKEKWQQALSLLIHTLGISTGVIMQINGSQAEVLCRCGEAVSSYESGAKFPFGSGSYYESSIGLNSFVTMDITPDNRAVHGDNNVLRRFYGIPLHWDDGSFYGTLCLFSCKDTSADEVCPLLTEFAESMEKDLELLCLRCGHDEKSEQYARAMETVLQYCPGGIFSYSAEEDEQFSYISENMLFFLGYTLKEFVQKFDNRFSEMVFEEDRERTLRQIDEQIMKGPFDHVEYRIEKRMEVWHGYMMKDIL